MKSAPTMPSPVASSVTSLRVTLDELLDEPHAVIVRAGTSDDELIACGEVGGMRMGDTIDLGLQERNGSGFAGIAQLTGAEDQTRRLDLRRPRSLRPDQHLGRPDRGDHGDVNLRAGPPRYSASSPCSPPAPVLTVTADADGNWLPVDVDDTGDEGYVSADYVEVQ